MLRPEEITEMIEQLRTGAINELRVQKEHFLDFRPCYLNKMILNISEELPSKAEMLSFNT